LNPTSEEPQSAGFNRRREQSRGQKKVTAVTGNKKDKQNNKEKEKERTKKTEQ
jgi:hypothetical protein